MLSPLAQNVTAAAMLNGVADGSCLLPEANAGIATDALEHRLGLASQTRQHAASAAAVRMHRSGALTVLVLFAFAATSVPGAHAQCSWSCPNGYTLADASTGNCTSAYSATSAYTCSSGWALAGTTCSKDLCVTVCYSVPGTNPNFKACAGTYIAPAAYYAPRAAYSCSTAEGGPGGLYCKRVPDGADLCWTTYS